MISLTTEVRSVTDPTLTKWFKEEIKEITLSDFTTGKYNFEKL